MISHKIMNVINSLWCCDAIWQYRPGSILALVMACCLTAPSHQLNKYRFLISEVLWHSPESNVTSDCLDSKIHVAHMGPTWVLLAPCGLHEPCYQGGQATIMNDECENYAFLITYPCPDLSRAFIKKTGSLLVEIMDFNIKPSQIARSMGPVWGPSGDNKTQVGPTLASWTLLSGILWTNWLVGK